MREIPKKMQQTCCIRNVRLKATFPTGPVATCAEVEINTTGKHSICWVETEKLCKMEIAGRRLVCECFNWTKLSSQGCWVRNWIMANAMPVFLFKSWMMVHKLYGVF